MTATEHKASRDEMIMTTFMAKDYCNSKFSLVKIRYFPWEKWQNWVKVKVYDDEMVRSKDDYLRFAHCFAMIL